MVAQFIAGLSAGARALLNTPAGKRAIDRGSQSVMRFLKKNADDIKPPTDKQLAAGQRLQKTMKGRALNKNVKVGVGSGAAGVAAGRVTKPDDKKREDFRDMKADALKDARKKRVAAFEEARVNKTRKDSAALLNKGGMVKKAAYKKGGEISKTEARNIGLTGQRTRDLAAKRRADKLAQDKKQETGGMQPLRRPSSKRMMGSERALTRAIGKGVDTIVGKRTSLNKLKKTDTEYRSGKNAGGMIKAYKKGGVVKKKGIDGIAKRGKTRATRSR